MDQLALLIFLGKWVIYSLVLVGLSVAFSGSIVLGNASVSTGMSAVFCGFLITIVLFLVPIAVTKSDMAIKDPRFWLLVDFAAMGVLIWVLKRLEVLTGLGISNIPLVLLSALIISAIDLGIDKYSIPLLKKGK